MSAKLFCDRLNFDYIVGVPSSELSIFFENLGPQTIIAPREDDAVAFAAGLSICKKKVLVVIQSSGLGNCLNVLSSLIIPYDFPLTLLVSARGGVIEENEVQRALGENAYNVLKLFLPGTCYIDQPEKISYLQSHDFDERINFIIVRHDLLKQWIKYSS